MIKKQDGAGIDSSTTTVNWAMAEMLNPGVLKKAQDEVRGVFDGKDGVGECLFHELNYLILVIKETLRLHSPGPLLLPRESRERYEIDGYEIPVETWVLVNAWAMGRYPMYWQEAESFHPERFVGKPLDFNATEMEYIPFDAGRRICPGIAFGVASIEIQLAMLLYHFYWIRPHGIQLDMEESFGISGRKNSILHSFLS